MTTQFEKDSNKYNRKYAIHSLALEILRNGPSMMTMVEAIAEATRIYDNGNKPVKIAQ